MYIYALYYKFCYPSLKLQSGPTQTFLEEKSEFSCSGLKLVVVNTTYNWAWILFML